MRKGLTEDEVQAALGDLDADGPLDGPTVAALRLADVLSGPTAVVDAALADELARHYDEGQLLELAAALCVGSGWQRMIEAFGIRPDLWTESTPLPFQPPAPQG
jgi:alkylhydroperoxidase family enzyme